MHIKFHTRITQRKVQYIIIYGHSVHTKNDVSKLYTKRSCSGITLCFVRLYHCSKVKLSHGPSQKVRVPNIRCDRSKINKCQLKLIVSKKNNLTCLSNCKQWGELLSSWINWSATDFRQVIQLANWRLSDIKQPKWCRFFGRRIFFATCFRQIKFFCAKNIFSSYLATMATGSVNPAE